MSKKNGQTIDTPTPTTTTPDYPATGAVSTVVYRVLWRWASKPTWHDRGFLNTKAEADAVADAIVRLKGMTALTAVLEYNLTTGQGR